MLHFQTKEAYKVSLDNCNNLKKNNLKMMFSTPTAILTTNIKQTTYKVGYFTIKAKFKKIFILLFLGYTCKRERSYIKQNSIIPCSILEYKSQ